MAHSLEAMFHPKAVAVIGASDTKSRIGGRPIHFCLQGKFRGDIYPINPNREIVQGLKAYPSIKDTPTPVECAIVAVPADIALGAIRDCIDAGVKSAVIFTSGFAEAGDGGAKVQREMEAMIRESPMRAIGPNCLGMFTVTEGWYATFASAPDTLKVPPGPVGIVTQSGAYGSHVFIAAQERRVGNNYWVTTGNECDVDVAEIIKFYAQAPDVQVIMASAEGVRNPDRMCEALEMARDAEKPVVFQKVGRTELGAQAAKSHTASLAGSDAIYDALFKQYGVYRAETTEEMIDIAYACQFGRRPAGRKLCIQTISGGIGVQMADAAEKFGLDVPPMPEQLQKDLKAKMPFATLRNPVDFSAQTLNEPEKMVENLRRTFTEADYDGTIVYMAGVPGTPLMGAACLDIMRGLRGEFPDELLFMCMAGSAHIVPEYEALQYPCFEDPDGAVRALAALAYFGEVFKHGRGDAPPAAPKDMLPAPDRAVAEHEAKRIIASVGIPVSRESLVQSAADAVAAWRDIGGPVVLKIASPDIPHKTEIGGVILNLNDAAAVSAGYETLIQRAKTAKPDARIDGVIVAEMAGTGVECVMGVVRDPAYGPAVMFGLGGIFVEVLKDVTFRIAPFGVDEARRMIDEIQGRAMLDGVRGQPPADIDALADALARLSVFAHANRDKIESIDINPFIVLPHGAVAVDALIDVPGDGE
ncbi:MAG: acetate--CoA ligase family protein [Rhodospirillaceae bacterium]